MPHIFIPENQEFKLEINSAELPDHIPVHQLVKLKFQESFQESPNENLKIPLTVENYFLLEAASQQILKGNCTLSENGILPNQVLVFQPFILFSQILEQLPYLLPQNDPNGDKLEKRWDELTRWLPVIYQLPQLIEQPGPEKEFYGPLLPVSLLIRYEGKAETDPDLKIYLCYDGLEQVSYEELLQNIGELIYLAVLGQTQPLLDEVDAIFLKQNFPALGNQLVDFLHKILHQKTERHYSKLSEMVDDFKLCWEQWWQQRDLYKSAREQADKYGDYNQALLKFNQINLEYQLAWELLPAIEKTEEELVTTVLSNPHVVDLQRFAILEQRRKLLEGPQVHHVPDLAQYLNRLEQLWYYAQAALKQRTSDLSRLREAQEVFTRLEDYKDANTRKAAVTWKISYYNTVKLLNNIRERDYQSLREAQRWFQRLKEELQNFKAEDTYLDVLGFELELNNYLEYSSARELEQKKQLKAATAKYKSLPPNFRDVRWRIRRLTIRNNPALLLIAPVLFIVIAVLILFGQAGGTNTTKSSATATALNTPTALVTLPPVIATAIPTLPVVVNPTPTVAITSNPVIPTVTPTFSVTQAVPTATTTTAKLPVLYAFFSSADAQNPNSEFTTGQKVMVVVVYEPNGFDVNELEGNLYLNNLPKANNKYKLDEQPEKGKLVIDLGQLDSEGSYKFELKIPNSTETRTIEFKVNPAPTTAPATSTPTVRPRTNPPASNPGNGGSQPVNPPQNNPPPNNPPQNNPPPNNPPPNPTPWVNQTVTVPPVTITVKW